MSKEQDERCVKCIRSMAPAIRRAAVVRIWKEMLKREPFEEIGEYERSLKIVLLQVSPGTDLDSLDGEPRFAP